MAEYFRRWGFQGFATRDLKLSRGAILMILHVTTTPVFPGFADLRQETDFLKKVKKVRYNV